MNDNLTDSMFLSHPPPPHPRQKKKKARRQHNIFKAVRENNCQHGIPYSFNPFSFFRSIRTKRGYQEEILAERTSEGYTFGKIQKEGSEM